jgi:hypothetical protein
MVRLEELTKVLSPTNSAASISSSVQLQPTTPQHITSARPPQPQPVAMNIEEEANSYFQRIYDSKMSIADVVSMLIKFKNPASSQRDKDIYACMIHNLFDEFRFFNKYPEKELRTTAVLFGTLIRHDLTGPFSTKAALRYILGLII